MNDPIKHPQATGLTAGTCAARTDNGPRAAFFSRIVGADPDELAEQVHDWDLKWTPLGPGGFAGSVVTISLGPLRLYRATFDRPLLQCSTSPAGRIAVTRAAAGCDPVIVQGRLFEPDECAVFGPRAEIEAFNRGVHRTTAVTIPLDLWQRDADWLDESDLARASGVEMRKPGAAWVDGFLQRCEWILEAAEQVAEGIARSDVRDSMAESLLAFVNTLGDTTPGVRNDRDSRPHRRAAVERARAYIDAHLTEPIRLGDLCRHARTQARSLEYGFQELLGTSPLAYVRLMRLHSARRLLRSTTVRNHGISEIALDCGFWHLSQFAVDYKRRFGEKPSDTRNRTLAQLPRSERRGQLLGGRHPPAGRHVGSLG